MEHFEIYESGGRKSMYLLEDWDDALCWPAFLHHSIETIMISSRVSSLAFLEKIPWITGIYIHSLREFNQNDINCLYSLNMLENFTCIDGKGNSIDLARFPLLNYSELYYHKNLCTIFECANLKRLVLHRVNEPAVHNLENLANIEKLSVFGSNAREISLHNNLSKLTSIRLSTFRRLENCRFLEKCPNVEELFVQYSKGFSDLKFLEFLPNLKSLIIESDEVFVNLDQLEFSVRLERLGLGRKRKVVVAPDLVQKLKELPSMKHMHFSGIHSSPWRREESSVGLPG